jgi:hypothetical protein
MNKYLYQSFEKQKDPILSKTCCGCKQEKIINEFRKGTGKGGTHNLCIPCQNEYNKLKYQQNKERRKAQVIKWNNEHPEKLEEYQDNWAVKHNKSHKRRKTKATKEDKAFLDSIPNF